MLVAINTDLVAGLEALELRARKLPSPYWEEGVELVGVTWHMAGDMGGGSLFPCLELIRRMLEIIEKETIG